MSTPTLPSTRSSTRSGVGLLAGVVAVLAAAVVALGIAYQARNALISQLQALSRSHVAQIRENQQAIASADRTIGQLQDQLNVAVADLRSHGLPVPVVVQTTPTPPANVSGGGIPSQPSQGPAQTPAPSTTTTTGSTTTTTTTTPTAGCVAAVASVCLLPADRSLMTGHHPLRADGRVNPPG